MNSPIKKVAVVSLIVLIIGLFAFIAITIAHMTRTDAEPLGTETSENLNAQVFQPVEYEQYNYYNLNLDADSEALLRYSDPEVLTNMPGTNFDTTPPTITDAVVSSNILTLSFSETLNPNSQPATSNFIVTFGSTNITVSSVSVTDTRVMLTLATNALHTTVVTVTHTPTDTQIRDLAGNASPGFTRVATNSTPPIDIPTDTTPPTVTNARISNKTLTLTYNETIDQNSVPPTSAFTLRKNNGSSVNITRVRISGSSVILDLDTNPGTGSITLKYAVPSSNPIQDAVGNDAPAFSNQTVTVTSVVTTNTTSNPNTTNSTVRSNTNTTVTTNTSVQSATPTTINTSGMTQTQLKELLGALQIRLNALIAARSGTSSGGTSAPRLTTSSSSAVGQRSLRIGDSGADVTKLQQYLITKGYLVVPASTTLGKFGRLTQAALIQFQLDKNISPASGIYGPITRAYITAHP